MDIGKIIADERGKLNLSQRALAQKAGVRQATLSSIESGGDVKLATLRNILLALGRDINIAPARAGGKSVATARAKEIKRVNEHFRLRREQLQALLDTQSARQIHRVRAINQQTNTGYLAELETPR